jgi:hypothetical protein
MANWNRPGFNAALSLILICILANGCAGGGETLAETGGQTLPQEVATEYLLTTAGFQQWDVNYQTPKRQALLDTIPPGKIATYQRNGQVYHAYADKGSRALYIGDEAAYQKYLSLTRGRKLCERVPGRNQVEFWSCMEEYQQRGAVKQGK